MGLPGHSDLDSPPRKGLDISSKRLDRHGVEFGEEIADNASVEACVSVRWRQSI